MTKKTLSSFLLLLVVGMVIFCGCASNKTAVNVRSISDSLISDPGVIINGVIWATRNVDAPGTFAATPTDTGMFYQWNSKIGWSSTNPIVSSNSKAKWNTTYPESNIWEESNDPSPSGWRVPTLDEIKKLLDTEKVTNEWTTVNGVNGRRFTDKISGNSIFLPAAGLRNFNDGKRYEEGLNGSYWSNIRTDIMSANYLNFYNAYAVSWSYSNKCGFSVRCVAE